MLRGTALSNLTQAYWKYAESIGGSNDSVLAIPNLNEQTCKEAQKNFAGYDPLEETPLVLLTKDGGLGYPNYGLLITTSKIYLKTAQRHASYHLEKIPSVCLQDDVGGKNWGVFNCGDDVNGNIPGINDDTLVAMQLYFKLVNTDCSAIDEVIWAKLLLQTEQDPILMSLQVAGARISELRKAKQCFSENEIFLRRFGKTVFTSHHAFTVGAKAFKVNLQDVDDFVQLDVRHHRIHPPHIPHGSHPALAALYIAKTTIEVFQTVNEKPDCCLRFQQGQQTLLDTDVVKHQDANELREFVEKVWLPQNWLANVNWRFADA